MSTAGSQIKSILGQLGSMEADDNEEYEHSYYPITLPDVPAASPCSVPSFGSGASPTMMEFPRSLSLQSSPQYSSAMATPPAFGELIYPPSPFSDSTPYMSENNESPWGVPMLQLPLMQYTPASSPWWNSLQHRSSSFHSSSSLSFSSSQGGSSASSCSPYYRGDRLSAQSTGSSFNGSAELVLVSPSENFEGPNAPGDQSDGDVNRDNNRRKKIGDANNLPMSSRAQFNEKQEPYAVIIYRALMSVPDKRMVLADIYDYFRQNQPARAERDSGWKNSIRHNLSMNGDFIKEPLPDEPQDNAKRNIWVLSEHAQKHGITSTTRYRRTSTRPPKRFQPTRRKQANNSRKRTRRASSPLEQQQLSPPRIERLDEMAIQTPLWTPPQTPTVSPNPSEPAFANAGYQVEVPEIATDAHVKSEDLDYHLGTNNHSSMLIASYSPDVFENTHFGHHELYVREPEIFSLRLLSRGARA
ncbi:hypothetical protein BDD12DRAFT_880464 [Trichophaea hybrida]|nr:hypothetical protein BDD12DRAFT_880464 [Trichophaea hybrida]